MGKIKELLDQANPTPEEQEALLRRAALETEARRDYARRKQILARAAAKHSGLRVEAADVARITNEFPAITSDQYRIPEPPETLH